MVAIVVGAYSLYKNIEFEEIEYDVAQSLEARTNDLLAAGFLLETEGFDFDVKNNRRVFAELDDSDGVLWLTDSTELEDKREAEKIIAWVKAGGILLTSPAGSSGLDESTISGWLFEQIGIEGLDEELDEKSVEADEPIHDDSTDENDVAVQNNDIQSTFENDWETITLPDTGLENPEIKIFSDYDPYFQVVDEVPQNTQTIIDTPFLIHRTLGDGYVAVYSDQDLFNTDRLDDAEQGYLLLWLTQPAQDKSVSIVFRPASTPGLFTVLWSKYTLAICLLGLALIGFLRWAASRLGPIEQEIPPIKNNIMAHLEASGEFWYRHKYIGNILGDVQLAAQESMLARSGKLSTGNVTDTNDKAALIKQACEKLQCTPEQAEHVLFGKAKTDSAILRMSCALQSLNHHKQYKSK